nr:hypothetical protein [Pseudodesulfovibrio sp.]
MKMEKFKLIGRVEAAEMLGMTPQALSCHVSRRNWSEIPRPVKVGGRFKWIEKKIMSFINDKWEAGQPVVRKRRPGRPRKTEGSSCP